MKAETELFATVGNTSVLKVFVDAESALSAKWLATVVALIVGTVLFAFALGGRGAEGPAADPLAAFMAEVGAAIEWDVDSDDEADAPAGAGLLAFSKAVSRRTWAAPPADDGDDDDGGDAAAKDWAASQLPDIFAGATDDAHALTHRATALLRSLGGGRWETHETVRDAASDGAHAAAARTLAAAPDLHASLLLVGARARPAMPCAGEAGLLVVLAGRVDETRARATTHGPGACLPFRQGPDVALRAARGGPALCALLRVPADN